MMTRSFRLITCACSGVFLFLPLLLAGCGFHPVYGNPASPVATQLAEVDVQPQQGKNGQKLSLLLEDRFYGPNRMKAPSPQWRLWIKTDSRKENVGINSEEDTATRVRIVTTAVIDLYEAGATKPSFSTTERAFASYNILTDPFATLAAEDNATERSLTLLADRIARSTALFLDAQKADGR